MNSLCVLPLTTAGRRLGCFGFGCKQPGVYDNREVDFLHLVANQFPAYKHSAYPAKTALRPLARAARHTPIPAADTPQIVLHSR